VRCCTRAWACWPPSAAPSSSAPQPATLTSLPVTSLFGLKTVSGFSLLAWRAANADQVRLDLAELAGLFQAGDLRAVTTSLPLAEAVQAHRLLEDRAVTGWLLLVP
jgi:NADPH:quinone reductase